MNSIIDKIVNPFYYLKDHQLIVFGLLGASVFILVGWTTGTHFLGIFHVALAKGYHLKIHAIEYGVFFGSLFVVSYVLSATLAKRVPRPIDFLSTVLICSIPILIPILMRFLDVFSSFIRLSYYHSVIRITVAMAEIAMIWWLYCGIKIGANLKPTQAKIVVVLSIVISEAFMVFIIPRISQLIFIYHALL